ncbi:MAG: phosphate ABC transporter permease subunit PstC [Anaerolineales bacterium]|nr:phosphate ABC transporter permease subunit PstC [Anaerolineales bacterium]
MNNSKTAWFKTFYNQIRSLLTLSRGGKERFTEKLFLSISLLPVLLIVLLVVALWLRTQPILETQSIWSLLLGQTWHPIKSQFGFLPFIAGTMWVTIVAMVFAVPVCLLSAIYLSEYARASMRMIMKPLLDLLAAIPSVVYGVWGMLAIVPWVQNTFAPFMNKCFSYIPFFAVNNPTGFGIMAGGLVLAVMVAPFIIAITYEVLQAVPTGLRQASLAVGATQWETIKYIVMRQSLPGVIAGVVLGASRALGETMAVLMVVGNVAHMPTSIFDAAYPLPALIANNYGEMLTIPLYDAALMGAALILLLVVLVFNILSTLILRRIVRRSRR